MLNRADLLRRFNIWAILICTFFGIFLSVFVTYSQFYGAFYIAVGIFLVNLYFIKQQKIDLSSYVFIFTTHGLMLLFDQGISSPNKGYVFYVPLLLCSIFVTNPRSRVQQITCISLTLICVFLTSFTNLTPKLVSRLYDENHIQVVSYFNVIMSMLICLVILSLMNRMWIKTEDNLKATNSLITKNESLIKSINQNIDVGIFRYNSNNKIIYANQAWLKLFGYNNIIELDYTSPKHLFFSEADYERVNKQLKRKITVSNLEAQFKQKNNTSFWGQLNITCGEDENNNLVFDGVIKNITEMVNMQHDLIAAKEAAEKSSLAKSQFLSTMSHEIRTPMNAVIGASNLLLLDEPKPSQMENLQLLQSAGNNLMRLINNILDFSKIETGKLELEEIPSDLNVILKEVVNTHLVEANSKGLNLKLAIEPATHCYLLDPMWFTLVLNNLIANAVKFTEKGYVNVSLAILNKTDTHSTIGIKVSDTGIGIATDKQEYIFKSFSQEMTDTKRKYGGTGLGLAITKNVLTKMGSQIALTSQKGKGATFYFELILKNAAKTNPTQSNNMTTDLATIDGLTVLVVEDNQTNLFVIRKFLERWQASCDVAESGKQAIDKLKQKKYGVVLMDLHMPDMDGIEATQQIRLFDKDTTIIAMTADSFRETRDKTIEAGMNDFISKPFDPKELHEKLLAVKQRL